MLLIKRLLLYKPANNKFTYHNYHLNYSLDNDNISSSLIMHEGKVIISIVTIKSILILLNKNILIYLVSARALTF